jgi:peptidoglycan hydrolase-like protein with peptidoglycan-binding domain
VGEGGSNIPSDVAIVQLMLRLVKDAKQQPYFGGAYDGAYGSATKNAIVAFQTDTKLVPARPAANKAGTPAPVPGPAGGGQTAEKAGIVAATSATFKQLAARIPAGYQEMRALPAAQTTIYLPAAQADVDQSKIAIVGDPQLDPAFRSRVGQLVEQMYAKHRIALWLTPTGSRRTFTQQAAEVQTKAGPGESNHNFGRAVDIGFKGLVWVKGDGTKRTDAAWLNALEAAFPNKARAFWDVRDVVAQGLTLYRLQFERVHLQAFDQATVSSGRSLAALLNLVTANKMAWSASYAGTAWQYKSDLGATGGDMQAVGTSKQIWSGQSIVTKASVIKVWNKQAKNNKTWSEADVKDPDVADYKARLKADFESADANWIKWQVVQ